MTLIASHADHDARHFRFAREMNRRDGSQLIPSDIPLKNWNVPIVLGIGVLILAIVWGVS